MVGKTRDMIGNIGSKWRKIGDSGKEICSQDIIEICS